MIILRNKNYSNFGHYVKESLKTAGQGAITGAIGGGILGRSLPAMAVGASIMGGLGAVIGAANAKYTTPEYIAKQEAKNKELKKKLNKTLGGIELDKLAEIYKLPKIKNLLKTADCNGWDDYIYITLAPGDLSDLDSKYGSNIIYYFGNVDDKGFLKYFPESDQLFLGEKKVTSQNFKPTLIKYLQSIIDWYEKEVKEEGYKSFNEDFLKLQKELFKEIKARLCF